MEKKYLLTEYEKRDYENLRDRFKERVDEFNQSEKFTAKYGGLVFGAIIGFVIAGICFILFGCS